MPDTAAILARLSDEELERMRNRMYATTVQVLREMHGTEQAERFYADYAAVLHEQARRAERVAP